MNEGIEWHDLRITIPYVMGQLSERKVLAIVKSLKNNQFENAKPLMSDYHTAVISLVDGEKNLFIEAQQITFASHLKKVFDVKSLQLQFSSILDALLIDDENQYLINIEGTSDTEDSHGESKRLFEENYTHLDNEIYGVGYRFLVKGEKVFGEFKVEPLVSGKDKYYYQWILNRSERGTIEDMLHDVQDEMEKERSGCYSVIRR